MCDSTNPSCCTDHANAALQTALAEKARAGREVAALRARLDAGDAAARAPYRAAMDAWETAGFRVLHAREDLDATPEGQRALEQEIQNAADPARCTVARNRLAIARQRLRTALTRSPLARA